MAWEMSSVTIRERESAAVLPFSFLNFYERLVFVFSRHVQKEKKHQTHLFFLETFHLTQYNPTLFFVNQ